MCLDIRREFKFICVSLCSEGGDPFSSALAEHTPTGDQETVPCG